MLSRIQTFLENKKYSGMGLPKYYISRTPNANVSVYIEATNSDWIEEHANRLEQFAHLNRVFGMLWTYDEEYGSITVEYIEPIESALFASTKRIAIRR